MNGNLQNLAKLICLQHTIMAYPYNPPSPITSQKKRMRDLLIYTTVANIDDEIKFSVLLNEKKGTYTMPSLIVEKDSKQIFYADNEGWLIDELYPALVRFNKREMIKGDREIMEEFTDSIGSVYDQLEGITDTIKIMEYAMENKMLYIEQTVQVSDTTKSE